MSILLALLPYIIAAAISLGGWLWADHGWCNAACRSQKAALTALQAKVAAANKEAEAQRARQELISKSAAAAADVQLAAAEARAANAESDAQKLLDAHRDVLARIELPPVVRDAYNASIRLTPTGTDPLAVPAEGSATGAIAADQYVGVCTRNAVAMNKTADDYDALYEYTSQLWRTCAGKDTP